MSRKRNPRPPHHCPHRERARRGATAPLRLVSCIPLPTAFLTSLHDCPRQMASPRTRLVCSRTGIEPGDDDTDTAATMSIDGLFYLSVGRLRLQPGPPVRHRRRRARHVQSARSRRRTRAPGRAGRRRLDRGCPRALWSGAGRRRPASRSGGHCSTARHEARDARIGRRQRLTGGRVRWRPPPIQQPIPAYSSGVNSTWSLTRPASVQRTFLPTNG